MRNGILSGTTASSTNFPFTYSFTFVLCDSPPGADYQMHPTVQLRAIDHRRRFVRCLPVANIKTHGAVRSDLPVDLTWCVEVATHHQSRSTRDCRATERTPTPTSSIGSPSAVKRSGRSCLGQLNCRACLPGMRPVVQIASSITPSNEGVPFFATLNSVVGRSSRFWKS